MRRARQGPAPTATTQVLPPTGACWRMSGLFDSARPSTWGDFSQNVLHTTSLESVCHLLRLRANCLNNKGLSTQKDHPGKALSLLTRVWIDDNLSPLHATCRISPTSFSVVPLVLKDDEQSHWLHFVSIDATAFEHWHAQHRQWLHPTESSYYESITSDVRRSSFLLGRIAAKSALTRQLGSMQPEAIEIRSGLYQAPIVCAAAANPAQVSIAHTRTMACALAFPATHPMGIDLEDILPDRSQAMEHILNPSLPWSKRAITMAHPGMFCGPLRKPSPRPSARVLPSIRLFEVRELMGVSASPLEGRYAHFGQFGFKSWTIGQRVLSLAYPKSCHLQCGNDAPTPPEA